jgi:hypothetical protein
MADEKTAGLHNVWSALVSAFLNNKTYTESGSYQDKDGDRYTIEWDPITFAALGYKIEQGVAWNACHLIELLDGGRIREACEYIGTVVVVGKRCPQDQHKRNRVYVRHAAVKRYLFDGVRRFCSEAVKQQSNMLNALLDQHKPKKFKAPEPEEEESEEEELEEQETEEEETEAEDETEDDDEDEEDEDEEEEEDDFI